MCELTKSTVKMSGNSYEFPFEIKDVELELNKELISKFSAHSTGFVRVGPKGYVLPKKYEREAVLFYNMPVRPSDVFVVGFPRSGNTLTKELVWLIVNDLDYKKAADVSMNRRYFWLEFSAFVEAVLTKGWMEEFKWDDEKVRRMRIIATPATERLLEAPSPRFIASHQPLSLLPPALLSTARIVYVARDPRDVAVSFYHLSRSLKTTAFNSDFRTFWNYFIKDLVCLTPYFEHLKEAWDNRHNPNVLFLFYDELSKDMPKTINKVAKFLGKSITDEQVAKLADHLRIDNFKKNKSVNGDGLREIGFLFPGEQDFIRNGKVGGWRDYFDEEMTQQAERWIADNLRGCDLRFPSMDDQ